MKKKIIILMTAVCIMMSACSGGEKKEYGNETAKGSGTISMSDNDFEINLMNIFAGKGMDIDYLGDVKVEDGCDVTVDSSAVNMHEPGDYEVIYTVTKGERSESASVTLTVKDNNVKNNNVKNNTVKNNTVKNNGETVTDAAPEDFKSGEVITGADITYPVQKAQTAKIELLSGKVAEIKCTTGRYIVSTRTDSYNIVKNKTKYNVKKLIVVFNTGEEQVLETIQKKID